MKKFVLATIVSVLAVSSLSACKNLNVKPKQDGKTWSKSKKRSAAETK